MTALIDHPATLALANTLLHFLWQGALAGLTAFAILRYSRLGATSRYTVGVITLAVMLAAPVTTFAILISRDDPSRVVFNSTNLWTSTSSGAQQRPSVPAETSQLTTPLNEPAHAAGLPAAPTRMGLPPDVIRTLLLSLWFAGVLVLSLRLLGGWVVARRLAIKAIRPVAPEIQSLATRVAGRLALDRVVRVVESSAVTVPAMIGWIKPVVLLPAAALAGLSPAQVEALIAHELAHVRRHDYLVNLIQTIVETLLFYHPAVWWISRQVRLDREHCCDDLAVGVCDRLTYVTALANLAAMSTRPRLALAATDGSLLGRVRRILGQPSDNLHGGGWLATVMIVTLAGGAIASTAIMRPTPDAPPSDQSSIASIQLGQGQMKVAGPFNLSSSQPADEQSLAATAQESPAAQTAENAVAQAELARLAAVLDELRARKLSPQDLKTTALVEQMLKEVEQASTADQQRAREARERAREQLLQEDAMKYNRLLEMQRQLDRERIEIEKAALEAQGRNRMATAEAQLIAAREALDRAKQQFEAGVVDRSVVSKFEMDVRTVESQLMTARVELQTMTAELNLRLREAELKRESERRVAELNRAMLAEEVPKAQYDELVKKLAELEAMVAARGDARYAIAERVRAEPVSNPNEPVRAGDLLVIEIAGEPDLPREYEVRADGTIRLPLIGSVRVAGSTAAQVRDAVAKQITDRGLGKSPGVAVSLRRPRGV